ncbi:MAG: hypothetical protein ACI8PT_003066, partial [Gammaproteobacteria bacterium]
AALEAELERETVRFSSQARNLNLGPDARTVTYSEILDFYTEDFLLQAPSLAAYVSRYVPRPVPETFSVRFTPYDWRVNYQP